MRFAEIKVGAWYETKVGIGKCLDNAKRTPPCVRVHIVAPFPRGVLLVAPKDVVALIDETTIPQAVKDRVPA